MNAVLEALFIFLGVSFMLIASLGILRMPDVMLRMHAATKAGTVGIGFFMLALANHFDDLSVTIKAIAISLFVIATAPVAAHLIARAAYVAGVPLWNRTKIDDLRKHYEREKRQLEKTTGDLYDPIRFRPRRKKETQSSK